MTAKVRFYRNGATIRTLHFEDIYNEEGNKIGEKPDGTYTDKTYFDPNRPDFPSINAAKRASRKLQAEHGAGCLRAVSKFPKNAA